MSEKDKAQIDLVEYVNQQYRKGVMAAVEHILRNHIDNPIQGEITREKIKAAGVRSVFFQDASSVPEVQFNDKGVNVTMSTNLIGIAQGHYMIMYDGTRRPLTPIEENHLTNMENENQEL